MMKPGRFAGLFSISIGFFLSVSWVASTPSYASEIGDLQRRLDKRKEERDKLEKELQDYQSIQAYLQKGNVAVASSYDGASAIGVSAVAYQGECHERCLPAAGSCFEEDFDALGIARIPRSGACRALYRNLDKSVSFYEDSRITETCRETLRLCGHVARDLDVGRLALLIEQKQLEYTRLDEEVIPDLRAQISAEKKACPVCALIEASKPRKPGLGDYIVGGLQALSPVLGAGLNAWMYSYGINKTTGMYAHYADQCKLIGVPCQPPFGGSFTGSIANTFGVTFNQTFNPGFSSSFNSVFAGTFNTSFNGNFNSTFISPGSPQFANSFNSVFGPGATFLPSVFNGSFNGGNLNGLIGNGSLIQVFGGQPATFGNQTPGLLGNLPSTIINLFNGSFNGNALFGSQPSIIAGTFNPNFGNGATFLPNIFNGTFNGNNGTVIVPSVFNNTFNTTFNGATFFPSVFNGTFNGAGNPLLGTANLFDGTFSGTFSPSSGIPTTILNLFNGTFNNNGSLFMPTSGVPTIFANLLAAQPQPQIFGTNNQYPALLQASAELQLAQAQQAALGEQNGLVAQQLVFDALARYQQTLLQEATLNGGLLFNLGI